MKRIERPAALILLAAVLFTLSGCYSGNIDQYFSPPQPSEEYLQLQELIDQEISGGSEYASPTRGSYRQSVQLEDLDGNGVDEAIVFFRDADRNLKINIYASTSRVFRKVLTLQGEGRSFGSVEYADFNGDGWKDLVVAWQIAGSMSLLSVYSMANWTGELLLSTDSTEFLVGDLNGDKQSDLLVLRGVTSDAYMADMYTYTRERGAQATSAALSAGIFELRRARTVTLSGGTGALMVESVLENGDLVTDLLVCREGSLVNLTMNRGTGVSETRRSYTLAYAQDIDGDGVTEIPRPQQLYSQGGEVFWSLAWYRYDAAGRTTDVMTTYHCFSDSWYLVLPQGWTTGLTIRRDDTVPGERTIILSRLTTDGGVNDLLAVYTITGENRSERAAQDGRFILLEETATVYAAELLSPGVDRDDIQKRFFRINSDWSSGSI